jgi:hypothetical protein
LPDSRADNDQFRLPHPAFQAADHQRDEDGAPEEDDVVP